MAADDGYVLYRRTRGPRGRRLHVWRYAHWPRHLWGCDVEEDNGAFIFTWNGWTPRLALWIAWTRAWFGRRRRAPRYYVPDRLGNQGESA